MSVMNFFVPHLLYQCDSFFTNLTPKIPYVQLSIAYQTWTGILGLKAPCPDQLDEGDKNKEPVQVPAPRKLLPVLIVTYYCELAVCRGDTFLYWVMYPVLIKRI